jgi:hypothetical protein
MSVGQHALPAPHLNDSGAGSVRIDFSRTPVFPDSEIEWGFGRLFPRVGFGCAVGAACITEFMTL